MSAPCVSPCGTWVTGADITTLCPSITGDMADDAAQMSTEILFELSGQRFPGTCQDTLRPCRTPCSCAGATGFYSMSLNRTADGWQQSRCDCPMQCGCGRLAQIDLGVYPLVGIEQVTVDGVILDPSAYTVHDWRWLVRLDGDSWPSCQDLSMDSTEVGTFEVVVNYGQSPPEVGRKAAQRLGCELGRGWLGEACAIPANATSITRQGMSITMLRPEDRNMFTGIPFVDLFLRAYNPNHLGRAASVLTPWKAPLTRRVTG